FEVLPAILVVGLSFALTQFFWSNYVDSNLVDIVGGVISIIATVIFLRFWKPKKIWRFDYDEKMEAIPSATDEVVDAAGGEWTTRNFDGYVKPHAYPLGQVLKAWMPFAILSCVVLVWGLPAVKLAMNRATTPAFKVVLADGRIRPGPPGWDVVLGMGFTRPGWAYPFFGTFLGWLGVALTGSDTSSNALFGSLQRITSQQLGIDPILMCAANSAGGVMGKMVDAQSITIATAA